VKPNIPFFTVIVLMFSICFSCSDGTNHTEDPAVVATNLMTGNKPTFTEGYVDIDGQVLHYVEAGDGPLLIFYHGFPSFWFSFFDQMVEFSENYRVVALDGLGSGRSSKPDELEPYRIESLASQLEKFARHFIGEQKFTLIGHDWGGALAWAFSQSHPERLDKLVVISAPPYNQLLTLLKDSEEQRKRSSYMYDLRDGPGNQAVTENGGQRLWQGAYADVRQSGRLTEDRDSLFRQAIAIPGAVNGGLNWYRANIPPVEEINDRDFWPSKSARTTVPAMLIWGEADLTFTGEFIEGLGEYTDSLVVTRIPDAGHWPMIQQADRVNSAIQDFLQTTPD